MTFTVAAHSKASKTWIISLCFTSCLPCMFLSFNLSSLWWTIFLFEANINLPCMTNHSLTHCSFFLLRSLVFCLPPSRFKWRRIHLNSFVLHFPSTVNNILPNYTSGTLIFQLSKRWIFPTYSPFLLAFVLLTTASSILQLFLLSYNQRDKIKISVLYYSLHPHHLLPNGASTHKGMLPSYSKLLHHSIFWNLVT